MPRTKLRDLLDHRLEAEALLGKFIADINYRISLVLVEGIHDEDGLRKVGVKRPILRFCDSKLSTFAFVEEVVQNYSDQTVLVLFDFDDEGKKMAKKMEVQLEENGVKIDHFLRKELAKLLIGEGIWRVEDIFKIKAKAVY
ncbi:MAG: hypothetical protein LUP94_03110 [Candidatus Methanomethylicus sp.]|nr:hypothetical protein [Candidatus Methanomethylicus sp.]